MALRGRNAPSRVKEDPKPPMRQLLDEESLVLYFANAVLPRFQLVSETASFDIGHVTEDLAFQQTVVAVSRAHHHLALRAASGNTELVRKQSRHAAIQGLRRRLEATTHCSDSARELFVTIVLLCMLEGMIEPSGEANASLCHLRGGYAILTRWPDLPVDILTQSGLPAHMLSVFATMDLTHALLSGDRPFFEPLIWQMFADTNAWWGRLPAQHRFLTLLKAYAEMASLGHIAHSRLPGSGGQSLVDKCLPPIEEALKMHSHESLCMAAESPESPSLQAWDTFCSLYELAASIYLSRALRQRSMNDDVVQAATRKGVVNLVEIGLPGMMAHCVILPLLIIGAHCMHSEDREAILRVLRPSMSYLSFGNMPLMADLLEKIWADPSYADMTWWQCFDTLSDKVFIF